MQILAVLDRSGSMHSIMHEAVSAFNAFIQAQKDLELKDNPTVTLAAFDHEYEVVFDKVPLSEMPELTRGMVEPRGMTALHDAIGRTISGVENPEEDTILLIQTDGFENCSKEYTSARVKELVEAREELGWDINFIGAGIDAFDTSEGLGIKSFKSYSIDASAQGMADLGTTMSASTTAYRNSKL